MYEKVKRVDERNDEIFNNIESAAFVVCLDDGSPQDASERCNQFFLGDPSNRWSDKNLQFIVCENGVSAFIGEHAMLDGMSTRQFNRYITQAILDHQNEDGNISPGGGIVHELIFEISPTIETHIGQIQ